MRRCPVPGTVGPLEGQMGFRHVAGCVVLGDMGTAVLTAGQQLGPCVAVSTAWGTQHWDWSTGGWGWVPSADSLKGVFLNGVCQYWRYHSRKTPPWLPAVCVSPRGVSVPAASPGGSQDGQVYDLGSFQTPVLTLGSELMRILCAL